MKNTHLLISIACVIAGFAYSCDTKKGTEKEGIKVTPRNTDITPANAYNNFFLDTSDVNKFITAQQLNDTMAARMRSFYNARNFQYAWFDQSGLNEQAYGFRSLYDYSIDTSEGNKSLEYRLNAMMNGDMDGAASPKDANIVKTELQLTQRFISYYLDKADHSVEALENAVPATKSAILDKAAHVLEGKDETMGSNSYPTLKKALQQYVDIAKNGGWDTITVEKKKRYKKGDSTAVIAWVKKRLQATGEMADKDTSTLFNDALEAAVIRFEGTHGHTPKGVITDTLLREMNTPAIKLVQRILINLERMRWAPANPDGRLILVNIPEFALHVWNGSKREFDMPVVVGKEGKNTTMFSGKLDQIVFSPYWNLPNSIVKEEVLPAMSRNKNYISDKNMEITGERNGVPIVRQLPGKDNPLGKVKFLFPNSFNIYFHDTNQKYLFDRDQRAFSHGCIRLGDPEKMANYLLADNNSWSAERIDSAMNSGKEKYVRVKEPVPVLISYYTAWVDEEGKVQFREDIYDHDTYTAGKLFTDPK
ncbi:L,D-transpeptidase family protein [Chitinophaga rhizophila]|uniref:L,D-transpeptidase family protein n=1 Tax=Chitinophaga rhizophila TaxID=2866212 RepID=A0ABS7GJ65_9BACT|nr:L,D-transpeptidase family protein [Chitinophaga rhizophila]MBW8686819.1 L,D-transpeptidase family protein [Chitinophaga rhizophila]